jgi:hypothetical protein
VFACRLVTPPLFEHSFTHPREHTLHTTIPLRICYENLCDTWGFFATSSRVVDHTQGWC